MSGCCGQGPVIISGTQAAPRVDVEAVLLCDVLPDGSVAGVALVEPVYDTVSGDRVGTRVVDPATGDPYTPSGTLAPCAGSGCASMATQVLCDDTGPFIRAIVTGCDGEVTGAVDLTLAGAPYTAVGEVGPCPVTMAEECASPTEPVATVGLCLADGTPIAVTVQRDCDGVITSQGWINLATGVFSAGQPPAGTVACGSAQSIEVSGTFCDVDGDGQVVGLVLVEYTYDDTGAISAVRLVDAVTGGTYTPTGTVTVCPAGVEQPERDLVQLCDTATDGTVTAFVRDYARDENGAIVGHSDYTLDGAAYTPAGTVGVCVEPCTTSTTLLLCDSEAVDLGPLLTFTDTDPTPYYQPPPEGNAKRPALVSGQPFWDGGTVTIAPPPGGEGTGSQGTHRYIAAKIDASAVECPPCGPAGDVTITVTGRACNQGPVAGVLTCGRWRLLDGGTTPWTQLANQTLSNVGATGSFPSCRPLTITATVPYDKLLSGDLAIVLDLETHDENGAEKTWTADQFGVTATLAPSAGCGQQFLRTIRTECATGELVSVTDTDLAGAPYTPSGDAAQCKPHEDACAADDCDTVAVQTLRLCDLNPGVTPDSEGRRCAVPFLRHIAYDCAGAPVGFHDTGLDGTTPYTPVQVVDCQCETGEGVTSSIEVPWTLVSVVEDPAGLPQQDFIYTVAPETDPTRIGTIRVHVSRPAGGACGAYDINNLVFSNTAAYTLTLDEVAQEMSYLRVDLRDFDTFEPVGINSGSSEPTRLGGTAGWNAAHTRIVPAENNGTGYMYWDNPPAQVGWTVFNQGGGTSCGSLSFQGMTVEPGGCCGGNDGGCGECGPVDTGVRSVTGTAVQDLAAEFASLQSISLAVLAGTVNVTMSDGTDVPIPAGVTLTWSVTKDTDTSLAAAAFAGADSSASYLLNWTYLS